MGLSLIVFRHTIISLPVIVCLEGCEIFRLLSQPSIQLANYQTKDIYKTMAGKLFEKENRIYKYYINSIEKDKASIDFIKDLFKLELITSDKTEYQDIVQLYNIVGFDNLFELIAHFGNRPIKLPKPDKIKKMLITSIVYYMVEILGLNPKDAGRLLSEKIETCNLKQKNINSIIKKLQQELNELYRNVSLNEGGTNNDETLN